MDSRDFLRNAGLVTDWIGKYFQDLPNFPVKPDLRPGDILRMLPQAPPAQGEPFDDYFRDFRELIVPGMTHWQHPGFMAYFPASRSEASVLAEMLTSAMGAQCMLWMTSPAAEELEQRMMEWMRDMLGLPAEFTGVIQDTASTATLVALLTAREKYSAYRINSEGFSAAPRYRVYASEQAHSSVDKAVRIAGIGHDNLVKLPTDAAYALLPDALEKAIREDLENGCTPLCVIGTFGTTSSTAIDPMTDIARLAAKYDLWFHVDAAYAGTALLLPEYRHLAAGLERADSFVVNPHKWMFTNFDCTVYLVKDKDALQQTFGIMPDYLKTPEDRLVNNYRDWGIQLGRRFRALKLWFVIRHYGLEGLQETLRRHIAWGQWLRREMERTPCFELLAPVPFNLLCFRYRPDGLSDESPIEAFNQSLLDRINGSGKLLLTQTRLSGRYCLRLVAGQASLEKRHLEDAWLLIREMAAGLEKELRK